MTDIKAPYTPGALCYVNTSGDIAIDAGCREFLSKVCRVVKRTREGLIQVALRDRPDQMYSFPQRNIDTIKAEWPFVGYGLQLDREENSIGYVITHPRPNESLEEAVQRSKEKLFSSLERATRVCNEES